MKIIQKRDKKAVDYTRYKAIKDRGDTPDKKTRELAEAFQAINEALIDELPKLFALTKNLIVHVLASFVHLQREWVALWTTTILASFEDFCIPEGNEEIVEAFVADYYFVESNAKHLGICNGSISSAHLPASVLSPPPPSLPTVEELQEERSQSRARMQASDGAQLRAASLTRSPPITASNPSNRLSGEFQYAGHELSPIASSAMYSTASSPHTHTAHSRGPSSSSFATQSGYRTSTNLSSLAAIRNGESALSPRPSSVSTVATSLAGMHSGRPSSLSELDFENYRPGSRDGMGFADDRGSMFGYPETPQSIQAPAELPVHPPSPPAQPAQPVQPQMQQVSQAPLRSPTHTTQRALFIAASLYEFQFDGGKREGGFKYLTYSQGEIFDVVSTKGEIWLARNQDDPTGELGWIWCKHFARLPAV